MSLPPDFIFEWTLGGMFLFMLAVAGSVALVLHLALYLPPLVRMSERIARMSPILQTLSGTFFGLAVTFLANAVWTTEDRAHEMVNDEALSIHIAQAYVRSMTGPSRDGFEKMMIDYAKAVEDEWPAMMWSGSTGAAERKIGELYAAALNGLAEGDHNRMLQQRLLDAIDDIALARQHRLTIAKENVSGGQWFLVSQLALLMMLVVAVCHGQWPSARIAALLLVTLAVAIPSAVIVAHDRPFSGPNAVSPAPILRAAGLER